MVRGREVISMDADFYMDDDGTIWFFYANDIIVRRKKVKDKIKEEPQDFKS